MLFRCLSYLVWVLVAGALGWMLGERMGALVGVASAGLLYVCIDALSLERLEIWLRSLQLAQADDTLDELVKGGPPERGYLGLMAGRLRHVLRAHRRALSESRLRLEEMTAAMQASPNGLVLLDAQGRIEWCNLMAAQHFGLDAQRDLQQYVLNLVRDPAFTAYMAAGDYNQPVLVNGKPGAGLRAVRLSVQVHPYGQGRRLLLARDVTLLEQAEAMRRDFVANVSHEIRTPLTVLAGFVETLQTLPLPEPERQRYLGLMAQQSDRMQTLVNDLLTLSRLEGSPLPDDQDWVSVEVLMAQCEHEARSLTALLAEGSHTIDFICEGAHALSGAPSELQSALSNLVSNAVRYTPAQGRIEVRWRVDPQGRGEFSVQDSGPGIAPEHLPRLTERFYRVDRSRSRETGGTGLGLAIVKHVVQRHGAELRIQSQPGQGARFGIVFPAMRVRALASEPQLKRA
jgi:two-component system phosphate regulon sensor histidine kinase PhoR